jgi:arabinofuranosyltransferase
MQPITRTRQIRRLRSPFVSKNMFYFCLIWIVLLILVLSIRRAWISDDAFITFRVIDNFINGYGLTWNPQERVQVYTHPLWMFLMLPLYAITRNPFLLARPLHSFLHWPLWCY